MDELIGSIIVAIVSFFGLVVGWIVTNRQTIQLEAARREERIKDIQTALLAEIAANFSQLERFDLDNHADDIAKRIGEAAARNESFTPFVPAEVDAFVMGAIVSEIHILPNEVIGPVILYYRQILTVAKLAEDLRSARYERLEADRKIAIYRDYVALITYARSLAEDAIDALRTSLGLEATDINSPVEGPLDHLSA